MDAGLISQSKQLYYYSISQLINPMPKIIYSKRKTLCLEIGKNAELIIRAPRRLSEPQIYKFIEKKSAWIKSRQEKKLANISKARELASCIDIKISKSDAYNIISKRARELSLAYNFKYSTIKINNAKTRWGSCSAKDNINFTKKIAILPDNVRDYIIIHELSHTIEKNHSHKFWGIVQNIIPNYKEQQKWLKENGHILEL